MIGNSNFRFQFLGPPSEAEFRIRFNFLGFWWDFFLNSAVDKLTNWNYDSKIWKSKKIKVGTQYTSFCTGKMVAAIPTSTQNGCRHTYIYSMPVAAIPTPVATIPTSTQNSCRHTYIYSKRLLPYLHLLKAVAATPTSNFKKGGIVF